MEQLDKFNVILLGVIFDPKERKILISRRENDPFLKDLTWGFPGGRLNADDEDPDKTLKKTIKKYTGYDVKNLGSIFAKKWKGQNNLFISYFLCEVFAGKLKIGDKKIKELKWIKPTEIEKYFTMPIHPRLKEYILNLK